MKRILFIIMLLLVISCGNDPNIEYFTKHGVAIYCLENVCYSIKQVEFIIDTLIDELDTKAISVSSNYNKEEILSRLWRGIWIGNANHQPYKVYIKKEQLGEIGSCPSATDPNRVCRGFKCHVGWCMGISKSKAGEIWAVYNECIGKSALTHEFMHLINYIIEDYSDPNHSRATFFPSGCRFEPEEERAECKKSSIIGYTKDTATDKFCN